MEDTRSLASPSASSRPHSATDTRGASSRRHGHGHEVHRVRQGLMRTAHEHEVQQLQLELAGLHGLQAAAAAAAMEVSTWETTSAALTGFGVS